MPYLVCLALAIGGLAYLDLLGSASVTNVLLLLLIALVWDASFRANMRAGG